MKVVVVFGLLIFFVVMGVIVGIIGYGGICVLVGMMIIGIFIVFLFYLF